MRRPFFFWRSPKKFLWRPFFFFFLRSPAFFFGEHLRLCPWSWPRAFLSLASRVSVLGKAVLGLGLGFILCPWPWPRALCPRLHLCYWLFWHYARLYYLKNASKSHYRNRNISTLTLHNQLTMQLTWYTKLRTFETPYHSCCRRLSNLSTSCRLKDYEIKGLKTIQLKLPQRQF